MKFYSAILVGIILSLFTSCQKAEDDANHLNSKILVEGYVFANEPVVIRVASVNANGLSVSPPAQSAYVNIVQGDLEIPFAEVDSMPGVYCQVDTNTVLADSGVIKLSVHYAGHSHTAQTVFPEEIAFLEINNPIIDLQPNNVNATVATVSWSEIEGNSGYCMFLKPSEGYPFLHTSNPLYDPQQSYFSKIIHDTSVNLRTADFAFTGNFDIYVTAIRPEYHAMYNSYGLNNLISAPSNIENGWGIFTAFNGLSLSVTVQ